MVMVCAVGEVQLNAPRFEPMQASATIPPTCGTIRTRVGQVCRPRRGASLRRQIERPHGLGNRRPSLDSSNTSADFHPPSNAWSLVSPFKTTPEQKFNESAHLLSVGMPRSCLSRPSVRLPPRSLMWARQPNRLPRPEFRSDDRRTVLATGQKAFQRRQPDAGRDTRLSVQPRSPLQRPRQPLRCPRSDPLVLRRQKRRQISPQSFRADHQSPPRGSGRWRGHPASRAR